MKKIADNVDLLAGVAALAWAVTAQTAGVFGDELGSLVDPTVAAVFALAALGRWMAKIKKA